MTSSRLRAGVIGLGVGLLAGCSGLADGDETCDTQGNCLVVTRNPLIEDPEWGCLEVPPPPPPADAPAPGTPALYGLPVVEWSVRTPLTGRGLTAQLCGIALGNCQPAVSEPAVLVPSSVNGMPLPNLPAELAPVPAAVGFDGFIRFTVTEDNVPPAQAYLPVAYYLGGPIASTSTITDLAILMVRGSVLDTVIRESFEQGGQSADLEAMVDRAGRGLVVLRAIDCRGQPAQDVYFRITNRDDVIPFLLPTSRLPRAARPPYENPVYTDELGTAGFANVRPGNIVVEAYRRDDPEPFGTADLGAQGGQISVTVIRPRYFNTASLVPPRITPPEQAPMGDE